MDPLLAFILGFIAGWYVVLFVWWMATRLCVRAGDMAGPGSAAMTDADRLRNAAEVAPNGIWGWELDGLDVALDPENGGDIPVMVANLLLSAGRTSAGWWCPEGGSRCCPVGDPCALHADALDLAKAILGDTDD